MYIYFNEYIICKKAESESSFLVLLDLPGLAELLIMKNSVTY